MNIGNWMKLNMENEIWKYGKRIEIKE